MTSRTAGAIMSWRAGAQENGPKQMCRQSLLPHSRGIEPPPKKDLTRPTGQLYWQLASF